ncbi:MAG: HIT family protein [Campylobacteraceae bacterium]|nr:HIT family protein [Campylobacteraceae bacterium]
MSTKLYENEYFYILKEESTIPWVKIFTQNPYKELSDCDEATREATLKAMVVVEKEMIAFYKPEKINIAMFGNYVPHVHIHVMARFKEDSHFPESMWGIKQRESNLHLANFEEFVTQMVEKLTL